MVNEKLTPSPVVGFFESEERENIATLCNMANEFLELSGNKNASREDRRKHKKCYNALKWIMKSMEIVKLEKIK